MGKGKNVKECPFCGSEVKKENFKSHLLKVHGEKDEKEFEGKGIAKPVETVDRKKEELRLKIIAGAASTGKRNRILTIVVVIIIIVAVFVALVYQYPRTFGLGLTAPDAPTDLVSSSGDSYVDLTWHAPADDGGAGITGYKIYRGTSVGAIPFLKSIGATKYYRDSPVVNGQTYYYRVSAVNRIGESVKSNEVTGMPVKTTIKKPTAEMSTSLGLIVIELDTVNAPKTAGNFINLAKSGFFTGLIFHRVIKDFMIQGGGYYPGSGNEKPASAINWESTGLKNLKYTISMARKSGDVNSASCQFFINTADNGFLDNPSGEESYPYVVFGKVIVGFAVVDAIGNLPTGTQFGMSDYPNNTPVINSVTITE